MKLKLYSTLIILFLFFSNSLEAKPRCDLFYDDVYNTKIYPTDEDIEISMRGNLCRCMTYHRIKNAIKKAGKTIRARSV